MISDDDELETRKRRLVELMRNARPAPPTVAVTGNHNHNIIKIHNGNAGIHVRVDDENPHKAPATPAWRAELLGAIRMRAAEFTMSEEMLCEEATRALGRKIVLLDRLNARELAKVYAAVDKMKRPALEK